MTDPNNRRVVTGLDGEGRSCVVIDGAVPRHMPGVSLAWSTAAVPADNSGNADMGGPYDGALLHAGGTNFILVDMPPGQDAPAFMHATDTIDYLVMIRGEVVLVLETGEVTLRPGDLIVDRGVIHGWRNDGEVPAVFASVTIPALPVGQGRTI